MNESSFLLKVTECEKPFSRGEISIVCLGSTIIILNILFMPGPRLPTKIIISICLGVVCFYYIRRLLASLKIDMDNSLIVLRKTFHETTIRFSEIQAISYFVVSSSFTCEVTVKLKNGKKERFIVAALCRSNLGSFSETIHVLRERLDAIVDANYSCREMVKTEEGAYRDIRTNRTEGTEK